MDDWIAPGVGGVGEVGLPRRLSYPEGREEERQNTVRGVHMFRAASR